MGGSVGANKSPEHLFAADARASNSRAVDALFHHPMSDTQAGTGAKYAFE
jgi:hypothetical protein